MRQLLNLTGLLHFASQDCQQIYNSFKSRRIISTAMNYNLIDIAVNLSDDMYQGVYHGKKKHEADVADIIKRAEDAGVKKLIVTGTNFADSKISLEFCQTYDNLYSTVGCHPTRCNEFEENSSSPDQYLGDLLQLAQNNLGKVVAIGECGLDYDRTNFCSIEVQKKYFEKQISLAEATGLPMFLHCRAAATDLVAILSKYRDNISGGVVHSFDGTSDELKQILDLDLYIGINGCSLKTEDNLKVASEIPLERLMLETDAPWCEIKPSHASFKHVKSKFTSKKCDKWEKGVMVKGRNEPCSMVQILEVLSAIRKEDPTVIAEKVLHNTEKLFFSKKE